MLNSTRSPSAVTNSTFCFLSPLYLRIVSSSELSSAALESRCLSLSLSAWVRRVTEEHSTYNSHHTSLSSHLKISEHRVGLFEEGDKLAHCLAEVLVGHPLQRILSRGRRTSSKGGGLEGSSGERHSVANQLWGRDWVSAARAASGHCLLRRRDGGKPVGVVHRQIPSPLDPDTARHSQHGANLPFENMKT